jgi:hypothetical protein
MFQGTNASISVSSFETEYLTHHYYGHQRLVPHHSKVIKQDNTALGDTNSRRTQQEDVYACMSSSPEFLSPNRSQQWQGQMGIEDLYGCWLDIKRQEGVIPALVRSEDLAGMSRVWEMSHG